MAFQMEISEIRERLNDMAEEVAESCAPDGKREGSRWIGQCGGKCSVGISGTYQGAVLFFANQGPGNKSEAGGLIDLIWIAHGCRDFGEAIKAAKSIYLHIDDDFKPDPEQRKKFAREQKVRKKRRDEKDARSSEWKQNKVREIWEQSQPMEIGDLAHTYLVTRCPASLQAQMIPSLRFHPMLAYDKQRSFPALIAGVQNHKNKLVAVWRIYLSPDGGKAPVENPKLGFGKAAGAAVRLGPIEKRIGLCEGVETGKGVQVLTGFEKSVFCGLSTSGIAGFIPPEGVEHVDIYTDGDWPRFDQKSNKIIPPPGLTAGQKFAERAIGFNVTTAFHNPPQPSDWEDVANSYYRSNQE